jgi:hypothetical protein
MGITGSYDICDDDDEIKEFNSKNNQNDKSFFGDDFIEKMIEINFDFDKKKYKYSSVVEAFGLNWF